MSVWQICPKCKQIYNWMLGCKGHVDKDGRLIKLSNNKKKRK